MQLLSRYCQDRATVVLKYAAMEVIVPSRGNENAMFEIGVKSMVAPNTVIPGVLFPKPINAGKPTNPPKIDVKTIGKPDERGIIAPDPASPIALVAPASPVEPVAPGAPSAPVSPVNPIGPTAPVNPTGPTGPTAPVYPTNPTGPTDPIAPVNPTNPTAPADPADPVAPVARISAGSPTMTDPHI